MAVFMKPKPQDAKQDCISTASLEEKAQRSHTAQWESCIKAAQLHLQNHQSSEHGDGCSMRSWREQSNSPGRRSVNVCLVFRLPWKRNRRNRDSSEKHGSAADQIYSRFRQRP